MTPSTAPAQKARRRSAKVDAGRPVVWLEHGWSDFKRSAVPSLIYGAWVAAFGFSLLLVAWRFTYLVPALVGGFLLVAPFVAIIFYDLSRQIEQGRPADGAEAVFAWRRNGGSIALWGLVLVLAMIFWERMAAIIVAQFLYGDVGDLKALGFEILFSGSIPAAGGGLSRRRRAGGVHRLRVRHRDGANAAGP